MSTAAASASVAREHNLIARFMRWVFFLPGRYALIVFTALAVHTIWWGHEILSVSDPMTVPRHLQQDVIPSELREGLEALLTPAQREYVATHMFSLMADVMSEVSDWVYLISHGDARVMAGLFTVAFSGVIVAFRMGMVLFLVVSALLVGLAFFVLGRYEFFRVWRESRVPDASGTWFAIAWQTRASYPWVMLAYLALPWGMHRAFAWFMLLWAAATGYIMGRTFTDRL